ncbi:MAG: DUF3461 family protein [Gammaproteobacteria bacterium]|nr:DUF3461 family protein [Gammaproteobacteria bacterium]
MSDYPRLTEMGILNPQEIEKFAVYTVGRTDILRIIYDRKKGSLLPVSKHFKFAQAKQSVLVDSGTRQTEVVYESSGAFREALHELEKSKASRKKAVDDADAIKEEIKLLQEDIAWRTEYINTLLDKL